MGGQDGKSVEHMRPNHPLGAWVSKRKCSIPLMSDNSGIFLGVRCLVKNDETLKADNYGIFFLLVRLCSVSFGI